MFRAFVAVRQCGHLEKKQMEAKTAHRKYITNITLLIFPPSAARRLPREQPCPLHSQPGFNASRHCHAIGRFWRASAKCHEIMRHLKWAQWSSSGLEGATSFLDLDDDPGLLETFQILGCVCNFIRSDWSRD